MSEHPTIEGILAVLEGYLKNAESEMRAFGGPYNAPYWEGQVHGIALCQRRLFALRDAVTARRDRYQRHATRNWPAKALVRELDWVLGAGPPEQDVETKGGKTP